MKSVLVNLPDALSAAVLARSAEAGVPRASIIRAAVLAYTGASTPARVVPLSDILEACAPLACYVCGSPATRRQGDHLACEDHAGGLGEALPDRHALRAWLAAQAPAQMVEIRVIPGRPAGRPLAEVAGAAEAPEAAGERA